MNRDSVLTYTYKGANSMDKFTEAYITAALWSSTDDNDEPLDRQYSIDDIAPETLAAIEVQCQKFQSDNWDAINVGNIEQAGHDFWLTRNGHGAGFWDGDWPEPQASQLTAASKVFGECDLYIGDDGRIYA